MSSSAEGSHPSEDPSTEQAVDLGSSDENDQDGQSYPQWRSKESKGKNPAKPKNASTFQKGKEVYVYQGRALLGPYKITHVYSDGTYDLGNGPGGASKTRVEQEDLKAA
ncbi:Hypothetical predicted protein [Lecanosticta acicola]|uniref:Uncharacterized protein n=1 Tax=Lecanosticta acicola TaxID=111012 RepID=A0AAI9EFF0_9PEZI|nr:Hypothetical predicted protein [Lecanosticta acicola]